MVFLFFMNIYMEPLNIYYNLHNNAEKCPAEIKLNLKNFICIKCE